MPSSGASALLLAAITFAILGWPVLAVVFVVLGLLFEGYVFYRLGSES